MVQQLTAEHIRALEAQAVEPTDWIRCAKAWHKLNGYVANDDKKRCLMTAEEDDGALDYPVILAGAWLALLPGEGEPRAQRFIGEYLENCDTFESILEAVSEIAQALAGEHKCCICLCIFDDPVQTTECHHVFCKPCLAADDRGACPTCRTTFPEEGKGDAYKPLRECSRALERQLHSIKVFCPYHKEARGADDAGNEEGGSSSSTALNSMNPSESESNLANAPASKKRKKAAGLNGSA